MRLAMNMMHTWLVRHLICVTWQVLVGTGSCVRIRASWVLRPERCWIASATRKTHVSFVTRCSDRSRDLWPDNLAHIEQVGVKRRWGHRSFSVTMWGPISHALTAYWSSVDKGQLHAQLCITGEFRLWKGCRKKSAKTIWVISCTGVYGWKSSEVELIANHIMVILMFMWILACRVWQWRK